MVHQHFKLVRSQSVAENAIIGLEGVSFRLDMDRIRAGIAELGQRYHMPVDPEAFIWQLSVGEQQRVEILKILMRGAAILIMDEPTAVLTPQEARDLGATLRRMADEGKSVVFISHKLDEVMHVADRVTVLRQGRHVVTVDVADTTKEELARLMVGHDLATGVDKGDRAPGAPVLALNGVTALNDRGLPALKGIDLDVRRGEILGIAGVAGNGQRELAEVVTGLRRVRGGSIQVRGREVANRPPRYMIDAGVAHIPGDRLGMGLAGNLPIADNLAMKSYRRRPLSSGPFLRRRTMVAKASELIEAFNVSVPGPQTPARNLSGGNQQKAILAREITAGAMAGEAPVLVAAYPTRGLDVGAIEAVRARLAEQRAEGAAVLLISEDLDELLTMADRIAVLHGGEVMGVVTPGETTVEELGLLMAGERKS
jgi:simple sugar transport system ATP-binding protein